MKVLIVDDSRAMRLIVKQHVAKVPALGDAEILEAENGEHALAYFDGDDSPDLVFSDWHMPVLDGLGFLTALRAKGSVVPFGFVTAERDDALIQEALDAGAQFVISKPFTIEAFTERVASVGI